MKLGYFKTEDFHSALRIFFKNLNVPVNYIADEPARPQDILADTYKPDHPAFQLMNDVYFLGMVDDAAFEGNAGLAPEKIESDYDGVLIFGVTLNPRNNDLLPTRSQLAEITRSFNREFHYTPVVVVFKYENHIAFANAERLKYKQEWREGEKAGKVSLLRDVDFDNPHSGHLRILSELAISRSGKKAINTFDDLYTYWQSVFSVSLLNKKFYDELSNWYFWAVKEVTFPSEPTIEDVVKEIGKIDDRRLDELKQEHNAKNVIRLLTRFLFVWFIKEKKIIPAQLFDLAYLKDNILKDLSPYHEGDLFKTVNTKSHYFKAVLQNLFFATLNQEMGKRAFRKEKQNMNVTNLLRYEGYFKNSQKFIDLVESTVPFMNGGLFECLDKPHPTKKGKKGGDVIVYKDGFSDRSDNPLIVPDYLFFGLDEEVDLSSVIGIKNKKTKQATVKGLINIFESYKFTIAENTPIEEDIALDPELLGKVFENLLASYNPETKTTARKQTGSFYTPREIVNYMVDESLIAYLKNDVKDGGIPEEELDTKLRQLLSFDAINPFADNQTLQTEIIKALDHCTVLDPACGSGAFPMGILQKMVHILQKVDPKNTYWYELQKEKALKKTESAFHLVDKDAREQKLIEINDAFDRQVNDPDYARKLFLIENCIYGVDIQPIAAQISKLRFFISLVVDQKVDENRTNFGIRPLPNLETKFVAANTLIGIEKPEKQGHLFANQEIKELEEKLKNIRHRMFSARTPRTKRKLREEDKALREKMGELLIADGWKNNTATQLAIWDPYDQNESSPFFDLEWMFGIKGGFDVVIGNPPYFVYEGASKKELKFIKGIRLYKPAQNGKLNAYKLFMLRSEELLKQRGIFCEIFQNSFLADNSAVGVRKFFLEKNKILSIDSFPERDNANKRVFPGVKMSVCILLSRKLFSNDDTFTLNIWNERHMKSGYSTHYKISEIENLYPKSFQIPSLRVNEKEIFKLFYSHEPIGESYKCYQGELNMSTHRQYFSPLKNKYMALKGAQIQRYKLLLHDISQGEIEYVIIDKYLKNFSSPKSKHHQRPRIAMQGITGVNEDVRLKASFIPKNYFCAHSCNYIIPKEDNNNDLWILLLLLNSKIYNWIFRKTSTNSNVNSYEIEALTMPKYDSHYLGLLIVLSKIIAHTFSINSSYTFDINSVIDAIVFELYFFDHMKEKEIDILQHVELDIAGLIQSRDFEQLSDSKKEQVINQLHLKWTHPDSEVRNRIKLFAVRSPEILKPILESK